MLFLAFNFPTWLCCILFSHPQDHLWQRIWLLYAFSCTFLSRLHKDGLFYGALFCLILVPRIAVKHVPPLVNHRSADWQLSPRHSLTNFHVKDYCNLFKFWHFVAVVICVARFFRNSKGIKNILFFVPFLFPTVARENHWENPIWVSI